MNRKNYIKTSNNKDNPNQNICALAVASFLGANTAQRYLHTINDVVSAVRNLYIVRSRGSKVNGLTVGKARKKLADNSLKEVIKPVGYILRVPGHVILLDANGLTLVDTAPRQRDRRKITHCYIVY